MKNKDYLKKVYDKISDFIEVASSREVEYFILDSRYSKSFIRNMKNLLNDIKEDLRKEAMDIIFDTNGDIVIIDSEIIGKYICDSFIATIERYYKANDINRIINNVKEGNNKVKFDFVEISYKILYNVLGEMYREIKCNKGLLEHYRESYLLNNYIEEDIPIVIVAFLIVEDICKYVGIDNEILLQCSKMVGSKKNNL